MQSNATDGRRGFDQIAEAKRHERDVLVLQNQKIRLNICGFEIATVSSPRNNYAQEGNGIGKNNGGS